MGVGQLAFYNLFLWYGATSAEIGASMITVYQLIVISLSLCFVVVYITNRKEIKKAKEQAEFEATGI